MQNKKLLGLLLVVAAAGAGGHLYILHLQKESVQHNNQTIIVANESEIQNVVQAKDAVSEFIAPDKTVQNPTGAIRTQTDLATDLSDFDTLFDESYDDASLEAEFTSDGANTMFDTYEI